MIGGAAIIEGQVSACESSDVWSDKYAINWLLLMVFVAHGGWTKGAMVVEDDFFHPE